MLQLSAVHSNSSQLLNHSSPLLTNSPTNPLLTPQFFLFVESRYRQCRKHNSSVTVQLCLATAWRNSLLRAQPWERTRQKTQLSCLFYWPLPSNGRLLWLHNYCFERTCHIILLISSSFSVCPFLLLHFFLYSSSATCPVLTQRIASLMQERPETAIAVAPSKERKGELKSEESQTAHTDSSFKAWKTEREIGDEKRRMSLLWRILEISSSPTGSDMLERECVP